MSGELDAYAIDLLLERASRHLLKERDYAAGLAAAREAGQAAIALDDLEREARAVLFQSACHNERREYDAGFARTTAFLAKIHARNPGDVRSPRQLARIIGTLYFTAVLLAEQVPSMLGEELLDLIAAGEEHIRANDLEHMQITFLHARCQVLHYLGRHAESVVAAEQALFAKRRDSEGAPCRLDCFLEWYSKCAQHAWPGDRGLSRGRDALTEAIELEPSGARLWAERGRVNLLLGSLADADADFTEAIALTPDGADFYRYRAMTRVSRGDLENAQQDFVSSRRIRDTDVYSALWLSGFTGDVTNLERFRDHDGWPGNLACLFLGDLSAANLLDEAQRSPVDLVRRQRLCEANGFLGLRHEREGDAASAYEHYRACVATDVTNYFEHLWATLRLRWGLSSPLACRTARGTNGP